MARPIGTKNIMRTAEEKKKIVLDYLNSEESYSIIAIKHNIYIRLLKTLSMFNLCIEVI